MKNLWRGILFWLGLMTGLFSLGRELWLTYLAATSRPVPAEHVLAVLGHLSLFAFVVSAVLVWWWEHQEVVLLRAARGRLPTLDLVIRSTGRPYVQEIFEVEETGTRTNRWYRVGVLTDAVVKRVRVVLESCEPMSEYVFPGHGLQVMGSQKGTEYVGAYPGKEPTSFVDVLVQSIDERSGVPPAEAESIELCYARRLQRRLPNERHRLVLRAEGADGSTCRRAFLIEFGANGAAVLKPD